MPCYVGDVACGAHLKLLSSPLVIVFARLLYVAIFCTLITSTRLLFWYALSSVLVA